jgi:hypothetical protein
MTTRSATDSAIPIVLTVFAVAVGVLIGVEAGRDPFLLYLITTPFVIVLAWLARGVGEKAPPARHQPAEMPKDSATAGLVGGTRHAH